MQSGKIYGYARVSSKHQNEERQLIALRAFGIRDRDIYCDRQSGKDFDRPNYQRLLLRLQAGDVFVVKSIDRLGRNYNEILYQWRLLTKEKQVFILIGSLALGLLQVLTGMAISVVRKVQAGTWTDALWDEGTWWIILAGVALAVVGIGNLGGYPIVLLIGLLMLLYGGTRNAKGFGKLTALIGTVYNGATGFFSDILSYARLMALMLAGSVIAQVFNTLGEVTGSVAGFVIISLVGNALNFMLNLLGCYVHDLRLQCLEFFGRFYKEGGKPFRPLLINTKYVDIKEED